MSAEIEDGDVVGEELLTKVLNRFGTTPAWFASLGVHILVLMMFSTIVYYPPSNLLNNAITTELLELDQQPVMVDVAQVDTIGSNSDVNLATLSSSAATLKGETPETKVEEQLDEQLNPQELTVLNDQLESPPEAELIQNVSKTGSAATESTGGTEGAIDRLTFELLNSLRERKTLVVWMFDASLSLKERRALIADRFENVYKQLEALDGSASKHLKTAVATFGQSTNILTPEPVDGIDQISRLVRNIKNDESGRENTFASVLAVARKFQPAAVSSGRRMMMVIVTDEKGEDAAQYLDDCVSFLSRAGTKCFVVGNAAPFGREKLFVPYRHSADDIEYLPTDAGPETYYQDLLLLPFFGTNGDGIQDMSAGYGPYALTRLCSETGGVYLIAEETPGVKFDPYVMRNYAPDYRPIRQLELDFKKNKAKMALVAAAEKTKLDQIAEPKLEFPHNNDNELREAVTEAQKPLAVLDYKLNELEQMLAAGEKDREKITDVRWQAAYDLAYGRVLAMRARAFGYNSILSEMKLTPKTFTKKGYNQWQLVPSKTITGTPDVKKKAAKAAVLLKRIIDDHPDTPWAVIAERELSSPMGWEWKESQDAAARLAMASPEEKKARLLLADEEEKKAKQRQMQRTTRKKVTL